MIETCTLKNICKLYSIKKPNNCRYLKYQQQRNQRQRLKCIAIILLNIIKIDETLKLIKIDGLV